MVLFAFREVVIFTLLYCCHAWKIGWNETSKMEELKTRCILQCPFQKQTSDLYADDITCEIDCKIEACVKGCHQLEAAFKNDCLYLCDLELVSIKVTDVHNDSPSTSPSMNSALIFCFIGCQKSLMSYFDSVRSQISHLQAPILAEHTLSATSLDLEWSEPNLVDEDYRLQCRNVDLSKAWQFCHNQTWFTNNTVHVQNLQPYTKYQFRIAIRLTPNNGYDVYSSASSIIATLPGGLPTSPPNVLRVTAVSSSIISVIWEEGQFTNGPVVSYILRVNEHPVGYAAVKDINANKKLQSYMLKNLEPETNYTIAISARNVAGLGPPAIVTVRTKSLVDRTKESVNLMVATHHSVYSISADVHEEPVLVYNTTHVIKGVALHVHRELLFISDSSGSVIVTSAKGLLTPLELPIPSTFKPSALTIDWLSDHLYILSEVLHPSGSVVYEVARCGLDGTNLIVIISGFIVKPHHVEVDPFNGYLFWVVKGVGLYRLDLIDISKTINKNVSPEVILEDSNLGAFLVNGYSFRILISDDSQGVINAISLDGQEVEKFCDEKPKFQNVLSLTFANGSLFWTNGENTSQELCDLQQNKTGLQNLTDKLFVENTKTILANTPSSQPFPVPANPPTNFQAIFGHDIAKVSWDRPYGLAGQGEGAWSAWSYRLIVENKDGVQLFDFNDIKAHQFTISSLKPGTEYILKVAAYTFSGEGPWSTEFRGKTLQRNASLLWSNNEGLLLSDVTGYRVTKVEPINYVGLEADNHFLISDIDWYEDQVFVTTNKRQVFWYNLTSNTYGRIQDINGVDCISVEWLAKKLYWGSAKNKMIFRSSFTGSEQEILPFIVPAKSLFLDSYEAQLYWSTRNSVEGASLDGSERFTFYESTNPYLSEIVGLALDVKGSELFWIEKTSVHPRQSALMILNLNRSRRLIDKFTLINQDVEGGICYIDQHLVWVRNDDKNAMISGLNGKTTALIHSDSLSDLVTCTAVDPFIRTARVDQLVYGAVGNDTTKINVIPNPVQKSSIRIDGSFDLFSVIWDAVKNVNYGPVLYRVKLKIDNVDTLISTRDTFIEVPQKKAYVPVKIAIQAYTYWATSNAVRLTLRSPSSTPSPPTNPRIFITHKKQPISQQKEVSVLFRWSPPLEPNGIIQRYELSCWVSNNRTNASGTTCSSSQISAKTLEFTLQNLPSNKVHNFQVRACTEYGCGNWSEVLRTNFQDEVSIPILMLTTNEGLIQMDYDRKTLVVANTDTIHAQDIFYDANHGSIFWIEKDGVYQSVLKQHSSLIHKLAELHEADGVALSYDWVARILYWVETDNQRNATIVTFDLNRNEEDRRRNILFQRQAIIRNIVASPMNSMLYWVEIQKPEHRSGTLMKGSMDGTKMKKFFSKDLAFTKNDISSTAPQASEELESSCNLNRTYIGSSITLHPLPQIHNYRLLWYDTSTGHITSSDLNGSNCSKIVELTSRHGFPLSITADYKRVYWLAGEQTIFSAPMDEPSATIEKVSATTGAQLNKILAYGMPLQFYPETRCLRPRLKPEPVKIIKFSADSITLQLPSVYKESTCEKVSVATVEYTVYYGAVNNNGSSNCTTNLKSCSQVVTHDHVKRVNKLKPYTRYVFFAGVSNYYSMVEGIEPVVSGPSIIYRTAPGVPSAARNLSAIPLTPNAVFLRWSEPEHFNAEMVGYSVLQSITHKDGQNKFEEVKEYIVPKFVNKTMILDELLADQEYIFWVKTFPMVAGEPVFSIGYEYSENVTVRTYAEPGNLTVANATSDSLNISVPRGIDKKRFVFEFYHPDLQKWTALAKTSNRYAELHGLQPKTSYRMRLKIWYNAHKIPFLWKADGFTFKTPGTKPSTPGVPALKQVNDDAYEITWKASVNFGYRTLVYYLEGQFVDVNAEKAGGGNQSDKYTDWTLYYNGTENLWMSNSLRKDTKYSFRVKAENEYGFSAYSNVTEEYEFQSYTAIVWSILPLVGIVGISGFFIITIYVCRCKSVVQKPTKPFAKKSVLSPNKYNCNLELVNLPEIPTAANEVKNNTLYTPQQVEECQVADDLTQVPRIRREQISLTKFLGSGAFGEVYEGTVKNLVYANIDTKVAIKALRKNATKQEKVEFLKEASLMSNFKHQHILQLLGVCTDNNPHYIILELMEGGDLLSYLRVNRSSSATVCLTYEDLLCICCDVASGCCYLEELHFVHRDLACRNCLVSSKDPGRRVVKIGDFGLARDIYKNDYYRKKGEGLLPVRWMAPESLVDGVFTRHSDVWSFGVLLWEVMTLGQQPYQARSNVEVLQYVRSGGRLNRPTNCPQKLYELMQECWSKQPKERPTFVYCLNELEKLKNSYRADECSTSYQNSYLQTPPGNAISE